MSEDCHMENGLIIGLGNSPENNLIEMSRPIIELLSTPGEFSPETIWTILAWASRINPRNSKRRIAAFDRDDMVTITGIKQFKLKNAESIKKELQKPRDIIYHSADGKTFTKLGIVLWPIAGYSSEYSEDGVTRFYVGSGFLTDEFFYHLSEYFTTKQGIVSGLGNRDMGLRVFYLYCYLLLNKHKGCWSEDVDVIKNRLFCPESQKNHTGLFNKLTLYPVLKFINERTNLEVKFTTFEDGKSHKVIRYDIECSEKYSLSEMSFTPKIETKEGEDEGCNLKRLRDFVGEDGCPDIKAYEAYYDSLSKEEQNELDRLDEIDTNEQAKASLITDLKKELEDLNLKDKEIEGIAGLYYDWISRKKFSSFEAAIDELRFYHSKAVCNAKYKNSIGSYIMSMMRNN